MPFLYRSDIGETMKDPAIGRPLPFWVRRCRKGGEHYVETDHLYNALIDSPMEVSRCARCGQFLSKREAMEIRRTLQ